MAEQRVGIVADCVCDLPKRYIKEHNVELVYFLVETDRGVFTDTDEITTENVLGYIAGGGKKALSSSPPVEVYEHVFRQALKKYSELVYLSIGAGTSAAYRTAEEAAAHMQDEGARVHVFDTKHLSTGMGLLVIRAVEMAEAGSMAGDIIAALTNLRQRVSTSFLAVNADYLYRNGKIGKGVKDMCRFFGIHPVLTMKDGAIALKTVMFGDYEKASMRYIRRAMRRVGRIDQRRIFITHAGCSLRKVERIKAKVYSICRPGELIVTNASATVSANCGPDTFGILFVKKESCR